MKNVYDKINDLDFESDEFELNDIERERLYMTAKTYKKKSNKKYMAVAAALLLAPVSYTHLDVYKRQNTLPSFESSASILVDVACFTFGLDVLTLRANSNIEPAGSSSCSRSITIFSPSTLSFIFRLPFSIL